MKSIKLTMVLMLIAGIALAQQGKMDERIDKRVESLSEVVNLSEEQSSQVATIYKEGMLKMKELKQSETASKEQMKTERQAIETKINEVLSEEQYAALEVHKAEKKEVRKSVNKEIRTYKKENVKPAVKAQRQAFDKLLSDQEKQSIEAARALKPKKEGHGKNGHRKEGLTKEEKDQRKATLAEIKVLLDPIIESHKADLEKVEEELKPVKDAAKRHSETTKAEKGVEPHKRKKKEPKAENASYRFLLMKA